MVDPVANAAETFLQSEFCFSLGGGAINAPRYWHLRDDACSAANTPRFSYPYGAMNFMAVLAIKILIVNSCTRCRLIFKRLSQDEGRNEFSKNLRASPFNDDLSVDTIQDSTFNLSFAFLDSSFDFFLVSSLRSWPFPLFKYLALIFGFHFYSVIF
jgi:hypothetical protein